MTESQEVFLKQVSSFNNKFDQILENGEQVFIGWPFWSWESIQTGLESREEWEVPSNLVPFLGDWHDLYCLNPETNQIIAIDDERTTVCVWDSPSLFISSLSKEVE
jgi:hypothetical protein